MQQPRIWLVEDEQSIADTLVYPLQQEGFQVTVFGRGLPALEAAAHQAPDVAILDVGLPDISGFELCRRLQTRYPALPVLFLTARSDEVDKLLGLEIGADDYIAKPARRPRPPAILWFLSHRWERNSPRRAKPCKMGQRGHGPGQLLLPLRGNSPSAPALRGSSTDAYFLNGPLIRPLRGHLPPRGKV